ncbi:glutamyl-tRNA reductase [Muriicola jejuensis]|uniref:Glutamyl-tRNA reductase n=1 Tax=Muriicola jejuensis TaxID=504488 RepID=A0A6P0UEE4_9FLAO|nr:hypothetical protein [Muriicola jejuensis]NER10850.1 hypothetical protein [Muriicola jejuensis]SMP15930.1 glutamyl-tRNA reductase [Muriicola jejuensis]
MNTNLRSISISHISASVKDRERFYFPEEEKKTFIDTSRKRFPDISGLMLLVTCNRTEVYFESASTDSSQFLDFFLEYMSVDGNTGKSALFSRTDDTLKTAEHLLNVSSGLLSKVLGDAEIIAQIKRAYQFSLALELQGSLLERAMQIVFRNHKRVRNETHFRDGTTSLAYKSLKTMVQVYGEEEMHDKKILFIGAGEIVRQLFKYNRKFKFKRISVSNRTRKNAVALSKRFGCEIYDWERVQANEFSDFDIIVGAAGNSRHLVKTIEDNQRPRLLIDLGLPSNMDHELSHQAGITLFNLDAISAQLENTKVQRAQAMESVKHIIGEELDSFRNWVEENSLRSVLGKHKILIRRNTEGYLHEKLNTNDPEKVEIVMNRVIRQLYHQKCRSTEEDHILDLIAENAVFNSD